MPTDKEFFLTDGPIMNPGQYASMLDGLPGDIAELCRTVQGVTIHVFWAERYGVNHTPERQQEVQLRTLEARLKRLLELDARPITEPRSAERKLVGNCRDFTQLLVAALHRQGIPARARCGFGKYFHAGTFEDHWVAEYWNEAQARWVLVDAQLDELQCGVLKVDFDPLDVPREQFIVGGQAWKLCRTGEANPARFGIFDLRGLDFVRGDLVLDTAALNRTELLPWDLWGVMLSPTLDDPSDLNLLDKLADLTCGDVPNFGQVRDLYLTDPRLRVPDEIQSVVNGKRQSVQLGL